MRISSSLLTFMAVAVGRVCGMKLEDHQRLARRQTITYAQCTDICNQYATLSAQCGSLSTTNVSAYSQCICSQQIVSTIVDCVNCGVGLSTTQSDINTVQTLVNTYSSACASLGFPISIPITTQPAVTFPCTIGFSAPQTMATGNAGTNPITFPTSTTRAAATTSPTTSPAVTSENPIQIPTDFSVDPAQLSLLSSLLGATTAPP